jgi:hypothetical protein
MPSTPAHPSLDSKLLPPGTHVDESGVLVIPMPAPTIRVLGRFQKEDLDVILDDRGVTFRVRPSR